MTAVTESTRKKTATTTLPHAKRVAMASTRRAPGSSHGGAAANQSMRVTSFNSVCNAHAVEAAGRIAGTVMVCLEGHRRLGAWVVRSGLR
jgi:hypothetical protein